jgi:hypothetical protein
MGAGGSVIALRSGGATLRASAQYACVDGRWFESAHRFRDAYPVDQQVTLFEPESGEKFTVAGTSIESMDDVTTRVRYRGLPWRLGGLWSRLEKSPASEPDAFRLRHPVVAGTEGVFASIAYLGDDWRAAAELPGAQILEPRDPANSDILMRVPVADLDEFSEETVTMQPLTRGDR